MKAEGVYRIKYVFVSCYPDITHTVTAYNIYDYGRIVRTEKEIEHITNKAIKKTVTKSECTAEEFYALAGKLLRCFEHSDKSDCLMLDAEEFLDIHFSGGMLSITGNMSDGERYTGEIISDFLKEHNIEVW